ncbi:flagellar hook-associated protein 2 [Pontibacillus marinus]|uniref:Flagellar hook-associated protein 2 n=1 Tax=Pontibacillus marinus BH030004 = DSM 16465 TaxID=1385511 RepID=A0A0A5G424_9BACI|nr:flagellar hook-associated protein 2 [Pontibacillus marinus]KGX86804.1 hypothetical protein N783_11580 [Pontibacillus marinus BH030004 = DSM 16465]
MSSDMRIGGLASGMDIDKIVGDLMKAERMPLNKMEQEKTWTTWQRDAYRDMNKKFFELKNMAFDMKLERTFNSKTTSSTNESAVTATATASSSNGSYNIQVDQLATAAINTSRAPVSADSGDKIDPTKSLSSQESKFANALNLDDFTIETYNEDGTVNSKTFQIDSSMSLNDVFKKINDSDLGVRAFYDKQADKVVMERTQTGDFNTDSTRFRGAEIGFDGTTAKFLTNTLGVWNAKQKADGSWVKAEQGGTDAQFTYNNALTINSHDNNYTLNGITFEFKNTTQQNATISVNNDVDSALEKITKFVDKYNKVIESANEQVNEKRYRDYNPLTEKQKESMEEKEIELWNEKAKSGLLRSDSIIRGTLFDMRSQWYDTVQTGGEFNQLSEIGITTSPNYRDGGKLLIDEDKLRQALTDNPGDVHKLFASDGTGDQKGIARKIDETLKNAMDSIENKAGKTTSTNSSFMLGRQLNDLDDEINQFEDRLTQIEDRYWSQFTQMEKAIQKMNSQSNYMMQQFG